MRARPVLCCLQLLFLVSTTYSFGVAPPLRYRQQRGSSSLNAVPYESIDSLYQSSLHLWGSFSLTSFDSLQHSAVQLWESYGTLLRERPVETKATTAAILACTGDAVAQFLSSRQSDTKSFDYDIRRGLAYLAFGALYTGCFQHYWFDFLDKHLLDWGEDLYVWGHAAETNIPVSYFVERDEWWQYFDLVSQIENVMATLQDPPTEGILAAAKVAVNQFAMIPLVYMPLFFGITGALGGLDVSKSIARARSLYLPLLQRNYLFWLPVQSFTFLVLPVDYQIPFCCVASLCWTIILSSIGGSTPPVAPSNIVAYETVETESPSETEVTVMAVDAGAVNKMTDTVYLEDVQKALVPRRVSNAVETVGDAIGELPNKVGTSASGLTIGLMASAVDDAAIGGAVGAMLGVDAKVGVAVGAAVGAGVGYLAGAAEDTVGSENVDDALELKEVDIGDDGLRTYQMTNSTVTEAYVTSS